MKQVEIRGDDSNPLTTFQRCPYVRMAVKQIHYNKHNKGKDEKNTEQLKITDKYRAYTQDTTSGGVGENACSSFSRRRC